MACTTTARKFVFVDPVLSSDDRYWWTRSGFSPAEENKEYIYMIDEDNEGFLEIPYPSFQDLFADVGSSLIVNLTCSIKMTTKIECIKKGSISSSEEWKMRVSVSRVYVISLIDVEKPRNSSIQKTIVGSGDKASAGLLNRIRERQNNKVN